MHPFRKLRETGPPTPEQAAAILAENVVMHSPVLIKPIAGRELVAITISNSSHSRDDPGKIRLRAKIDDKTTLLRWQGTVEGHKIESLELLTDNEDGLLLERTGPYRPFPALKSSRQADRFEWRKIASSTCGSTHDLRSSAVSRRPRAGRLRNVSSRSPRRTIPCQTPIPRQPIETGASKEG